MPTSLVDRPGTFRPMLWLTLPVLVEQMLHVLVGFTDLWLTGNFLPGEAYVAAMTLMIYALWLVGNVFGVVALGSTAMVARFVGARDYGMANRVMNQSILTGLVWALLLMAIALPFAGVFPILMGLKGTAAAAAERYLTIEFCVLPAVMVEGIAIGTAIGHCCGATILLALLAGGRAGFHLRPDGMRPDFDLIRRILRIGIPGGIDVVLVNICQMIFLRIVLSLGDAAAAAHGVAIQVEALGYMPGGAFQVSAATIAGQYLGARDLIRARYSVIQTCIVAAAVMVLAGMIFYVAATPLAGFFLTGQIQSVVPLAAHLLRIVAFAMAPLAVVLVLVGALRGAGDTRWPLALNLLGIVLFRVPVAYYLTRRELYLPLLGWSIYGANLGVVGAWYAMVLDIVIRCILLMLRFRHDAWQRIEV